MLTITYFLRKNKKTIQIEDKYLKLNPELDYIEVGIYKKHKDGTETSKLMKIPKIDVGSILTEKMAKKVRKDVNPITGY